MHQATLPHFASTKRDRKSKTSHSPHSVANCWSHSTVFALLTIVTGPLFIRVYGELEFGFSILKIMLIIGINIMVQHTARL